MPALWQCKGYLHSDSTGECWSSRVYEASMSVQTQHVPARMHSRKRRHVRIHDSWPEASADKVRSWEVVQRGQWWRRPREQHVPHPVHHAHGSLRHQHVSLTTLVVLVYYFTRRSGCNVLWWVRLCVCLSVCLSTRISLEPRTRALQNFLCMLEQFWGFSFPLTVHCTAQHLGPIQKRLNRSRCRLGWWLRWALDTMY